MPPQATSGQLLFALILGLLLAFVPGLFYELQNYGEVQVGRANGLYQFIPGVMSKDLGVSTTDWRGYEAQIVSRDPSIIYIKNFLSSSEASHFARISEGKYQPSPLYRGEDVLIHETRRLSEFVEVERDDVVKQVERRARKFQGWRRKSTQLQPPRVQNYKEGGFLDYHYDWDPLVDDGNRIMTFMIYLSDNCTGGETNFSRVKKFEDPRWCSSILDCNSTYPGITFRPVVGSAVFWENMYPNGSFHDKVIHAALPVLSVEKIGLNLWFWDSEWKSLQEKHKIYIVAVESKQGNPC